MRSLIIPVVAGVVALAGCTTNPYTGERQASKAAWGAGLGAAAGAAVGYSKGGSDRKQNALKGAAIGGVPAAVSALTWITRKRNCVIAWRVSVSASPTAHREAETAKAHRG